MRRLTCLILVAACGGDNAKTDAAVHDSPTQHDAPAVTLDCNSYCSTIQSACTTANLQYSDMATCVASCSHFPVGALADQGGDTLGCRLNHAVLAKTDAATHCVHAGPSGGGVCGMPCMGFCDMVIPECPTAYVPASTCPTACALFPATPPYTANVQSGNSASCRIYHATAASTTPDPHCMHVLPTGGPCS